MTGTAVGERLGQVRDAPDRRAPPGKSLLDSFLERLFNDGELHRRQELTVGKVRKSPRLPAYAYEALDGRIPVLDVGIPNGPVNAVPIPFVGFEVKIAPAISMPAPQQR